jgi:general stress protein 26
MRLVDRLIRFVALRFRARSQRINRGDVDATLGAARATMERKSFCVIATSSDEGIDARVVQPLAPDESWVVWLGTSPRSNKVAQLRKNAKATLVYEDDAKSACVTLLGTVEIVDDLEQRRAHFKSLWWAFFPDGPEGDDFVALRFTPERMHVWDGSRAITPEPFGLASSKLVRRDGTWSRP